MNELGVRTPSEGRGAGVLSHPDEWTVDRETHSRVVGRVSPPVDRGRGEELCHAGPMTELLVLPATSAQAVAALADGARVVARSWGAGLRAGAVDPGTLERALRAVADRVSLRELTVADRAAVLALDHDTHRDYPGNVATQHRPLTPDDAAPSARRRGFGAFAGDELVAMTFVDVEEADAETDFTVVAASWRGHGLSTAVKALSIRTLVAEGVRTFRTGGSSDNPAIICANRSLGYVQDEEWLTLARDEGRPRRHG